MLLFPQETVFDSRARCVAMTKKTIAARRSTIEVFNSHLALRQEHAVEADIRQNYAADVVLLTCTGIYRGHDGVRQSAQILKESFPSGQFKYRTRLVDGEVAFLEWSGQSPVGDIKDGADSFIVREGRIIAQTIHYTVDNDQ